MEQRITSLRGNGDNIFDILLQCDLLYFRYYNTYGKKIVSKYRSRAEQRFGPQYFSEKWDILQMFLETVFIFSGTILGHHFLSHQGGVVSPCQAGGSLFSTCFTPPPHVMMNTGNLYLSTVLLAPSPSLIFYTLKISSTRRGSSQRRCLLLTWYILGGRTRIRKNLPRMNSSINTSVFLMMMRFKTSTRYMRMILDFLDINLSTEVLNLMVTETLLLPN